MCGTPALSFHLINQAATRTSLRVLDFPYLTNLHNCSTIKIIKWEKVDRLLLKLGLLIWTMMTYVSEKY